MKQHLALLVDEGLAAYTCGDRTSTRTPSLEKNRAARIRAAFEQLANVLGRLRLGLGRGLLPLFHQLVQLPHERDEPLLVLFCLNSPTQLRQSLSDILLRE